MFLCDDDGDGVPSSCFDGYLRPRDVAKDRDPPLLGFHPDYFYECLDLWINNDQQWVLLNPLFLCQDPADDTVPFSIKMCDAVEPPERRMWRGKEGGGDMEFSQVLVFIKDINSQAKPWLTFFDSAMPKLREFEDETGIYGFNGTDNAKFFTQFRWLWKRLWLTVGVASAVIYGILFVAFFGHVTSAAAYVTVRFLVSAWCAVLILTSIWAAFLLTITVFAAANFTLNCFSAVNVIMAVGFGVEFTTHLVFVYAREPTGSNAERLAHAMHIMLPPILDGSLSTLLSILPLAFSRFPYVVDYFFGLYAIISCFGIFVGMVVLPCLLAAVGPFRFLSYDYADAEAADVDIVDAE
mmetsp:Transcript_17211/g.52305  ORF Transcript_17211/g.52305 Transcript_17211/m.52305 type:complete len:352 (-) Transcript_17211:167-1222(-)